MASPTLPRGFNGAVLKLLRAGNYDLETTSVVRLPAFMIRIGFHCPTLFADNGPYPGFWLRLWFPDRDRPGRVHQRGYTIINADPAAGTFDIDFLMHDPAGPASAWAQSAVPGEHLAGTLYGTTPHEPATGGLHVLVGDLSSLPAIRELAPALARAGGGTTVSVHLALLPGESGHEPPALDGLEDAAVTWTVDPGAGEGLVGAAGEDFSNASGVWVAGASSRVRAVKTHLGQKAHLPKGNIRALAYWTPGRAMGKSTETAH